MEEQKIIHGIIISHKQYGDKNAFIAVLSDESCIVKGWVKRDYMNYELGSQIIAQVHIKNDMVKLFIDSIENSIGMLFWNDLKKLTSLHKAIALLNILPENVFFKGLYDQFLKIVAKISISDIQNSDIQTINHDLVNWEEFISSLV